MMIYLDYNATTPINKEVADSMLPYLYGNFGNPSSDHKLGKEAKEAIESSRKKVAKLLNCHSEEIIFTSGGSEANNYVLKGVAETFKKKGDHIITSEIEHPSIINPCKYLERLGYRVTYLPVDNNCRLNPEDVKKAISDKTILVTIMHSNNETGTIQPIKEIAKICMEKNVLLHTDASQSLGKVEVDVKELGVDFLTVAGHKLYAPKGIGALYIREGINIEPLVHGASHEKGRRAGTENIILDVALGTACGIAKKELENSKIKDLTEYFYTELKIKFKDKIYLNGDRNNKLPNTLNISFIGFSGHEILDNLNDVAASTGSACHSGLTTISPVLKAMKVSEAIGRGAVRFSLGRYTTKEEIDEVIKELTYIII